VLEGLRGEDSIAELCRREGIVQNLYYRWSKDFLDAVVFCFYHFQWPTVPGSNQWNEGPVIRNPQDIPAAELWPPSAAWALRGLYVDGYPKMLRPESVECDMGRLLPYALFRGTGAPQLILN
jgi:hypothetical protein